MKNPLFLVFSLCALFSCQPPEEIKPASNGKVIPKAEKATSAARARTISTCETFLVPAACNPAGFMATEIRYKAAFLKAEALFEDYQHASIFIRRRKLDAYLTYIRQILPAEVGISSWHLEQLSAQVNAVTVPAAVSSEEKQSLLRILVSLKSLEIEMLAYSTKLTSHLNQVPSAQRNKLMWHREQIAAKNIQLASTCSKLSQLLQE